MSLGEIVFTFLFAQSCFINNRTVTIFVDFHFLADLKLKRHDLSFYLNHTNVSNTAKLKARHYIAKLGAFLNNKVSIYYSASNCLLADTKHTTEFCHCTNRVSSLVYFGR